MTNVVLALVGMALLLSCTGCGQAPEVVQGTVVRYDEATKSLTVRDERAPHRELSLSTETAEMGQEPRTGELVRIAYGEANGRLVARRVMNLTIQKELDAQGR